MQKFRDDCFPCLCVHLSAFVADLNSQALQEVITLPIQRGRVEHNSSLVMQRLPRYQLISLADVVRHHCSASATTPQFVLLLLQF
jgi:hypothetical protein